VFDRSAILARARTTGTLWAAGFVGVVAILIVVYFLPALPPDVRTWAYPIAGVLSGLAVLAGIAVHRPAHPGPWILIAVANLLFAAGDVLWTVLSAMGESPFPSVADLAYIAGYPVLAIAFSWIILIRVGDGDRSGLLDGATMSLAAALAGFIVLLRPVLEAEGDPLALAISVAYPLGDLVIIGVAIGMLVTPGARNASFALLVGSLATMFAGDVINAFQVAAGTAEDGTLLDLTWLLAYVTVGLAALLPSMRAVAVSSPVRIAWLSPVRLVATAIALLAGPALLVYDVLDGGTSLVLLAVGSGVLSLMVLARLAAAVRALARDNAARRALEDELSYRASHDPLTGLANRRRFMECLDAAAAGSDGQPISVLFIDLDDFKAVNDEMGHPTGDALLVAVAGRVRAQLRGTDVAARMGGDEFGILLHADERTAMGVARRLIDTLGDPVAVGGQVVEARGSIGVASGRPANPSELLAHADIAMYVAKGRGSGFAVAYEPGMHHAAADRRRAHPADAPAPAPAPGPARALSPGLT
jgi:diguanylate cyclase (GGDEF)-like protein